VWIVAALIATSVGITVGSSTGPGLADAPPVVRPSVGQIAVTGASPGGSVTVRSGSTLVATVAVDAAGSALVRDLDESAPYAVTISGPSGTTTQSVTTLSSTPPAQSFYDAQTLQPGFGYITTRDGTTLSANVTLPGPIDGGPYPTVVEYSGYDPSNPTVTVEDLLGLEPGDECPFYVPLVSSSLCDPPAQPSSVVAAALGYAVVSVNLRGTGCSGGAFDLFEPLQALDGYDVVETVAAQPWVMHGHVGMVGLSYPGITQLYVAATHPPHLAAITPQSVISDTYRGVAYPGGIYNNGFADEWITRVLDRAEPYGQGWETTVVAEEASRGVTTCADNQALRGQNRDVVTIGRDLRFDVPELRYTSPVTITNDIDVPVFLTGQWQDEQTGPYFANDLDEFDSAPVFKAILSNGNHPDGYSAPAISRWLEFLEIYVAERAPVLPDNAWLFTPLLSSQIFGTIQTPAGARFGLSYEAAKARFESEPRIEVWFESGNAVPFQPGAPQASYVGGFASWPPPSTTAQTLYLRSGGSLSPWPALFGGGSSRYAPDVTEHQRTTFTGDDTALWAATATYDWPAPQSGKALTFDSGAFWGTTTFAGTASLDLWLSSNAVDTDVEVTLSELRSDGKEIYIQSGWLRASHRALDPAASTPLRPEHTHQAADYAQLVPGQRTAMRVQIMPFAHTVRWGSKLRITIDAPGASRARWKFDSVNTPTTQNTIFHSSTHASKLVLPVVTGVNVPIFYPQCGALRAQPCRPSAPPARPL
jgi:hypothetical protein